MIDSNEGMFNSNVSEISVADQSNAMRLGISFNGIQFVYRDFKYDRLSDAVSYAELDVQRMHQILFTVPSEWQPRRVPSMTEQALMTQYGIVFERSCYKYKDYRYDSLVDAINYAQMNRP